MSGIRLEDLLERFRNIKIEPTFIKREANKKYFRDIEISVKADLGKLFEDHGLIPNTGAATRTYNEKEGYIELETFYSEIIPRTDKERSEHSKARNKRPVRDAKENGSNNKRECG